MVYQAAVDPATLKHKSPRGPLKPTEGGRSFNETALYYNMNKIPQEKK